MILISCTLSVLIMRKPATCHGTFLYATSAALSLSTPVRRTYRDWYFPIQPRRVRTSNPLRLKREAHATMRLVYGEIATSGFSFSFLAFVATMLFRAVPCTVSHTERHVQEELKGESEPDSSDSPSGHSFGSTCYEASDSLQTILLCAFIESTNAFPFSRIRDSVVECYDADNDRFHVTVFFGAGREASGRRRLAHDNVDSLLLRNPLPARRLI